VSRGEQGEPRVGIIGLLRRSRRAFRAAQECTILLTRLTPRVKSLVPRYCAGKKSHRGAADEGRENHWGLPVPPSTTVPGARLAWMCDGERNRLQPSSDNPFLNMGWHRFRNSLWCPVEVSIMREAVVPTESSAPVPLESSSATAIQFH